MMQPALLSIAQAYADAAAPGEACGLILVEPGSHKGDYKPVRNLSETPDRFTIHPEDWADAEDYGRVGAVVHSHPPSHPDPSPADRMACDLSGIPWVIVSGPAWTTIQPVGRPLERREFCWGLDDCYSLVRDWYLQNDGLTLPDFLRGPDFWIHRDLFGEGLARAGFSRVDEAPERGDVLLFAVRSQGIPNHCGIAMGDGRMLHHLPGRLSVVEPVGAWVQCLQGVVRHG